MPRAASWRAPASKRSNFFSLEWFRQTIIAYSARCDGTARVWRAATEGKQKIWLLGMNLWCASLPPPKKAARQKKKVPSSRRHAFPQNPTKNSRDPAPLRSYDHPWGCVPGLGGGVEPVCGGAGRFRRAGRVVVCAIARVEPQSRPWGLRRAFPWLRLGFQVGGHP